MLRKRDDARGYLQPFPCLLYNVDSIVRASILYMILLLNLLLQYPLPLLPDADEKCQPSVNVSNDGRFVSDFKTINSFFERISIWLSDGTKI